MQFVKVFVDPYGWGCNSIQIICFVYLYGVHVRPIVVCVPNSELLLQDQGK
jgi:hypothetical protein